MPRNNNQNDSAEIQQINFFSQEEDADKAAEEEESAKNTPDDPMLSSDMIEPSFTDEIPLENNEEDASVIPADNTVKPEAEHNDTEIIESEILPEQSVEATSLESGSFTAEEEPEDDEDENQKPPKKRRAPGSFKRESILLYFLAHLFDTISKTLKNSFFASVLTSYDKTAERFRASFLYSFFTKKPAALFKSLKRWVRRQATDSVIPKRLDAVTSSLMLIKSRIYGLILFSFAISVLLVHFFINDYFSFSPFSIYTPFIAIGMIVGSMFLIFSGKTLSETLLESKIFSSFGFKLLGLNKNALKTDRCIELSSSGAIVFGLILGFLIIFFPIRSILVFVISVIYAIIVIRSPETGLISLFLIAPFASLEALSAAIVMISVSYTFKVLCGRRTLALEFPDIFVGAFILMLAFGGAITFGEKNGALTPILFTGIYFVAASILRNVIWFKRSVNAVVLVGAIVSVYALITRFFGEKLGFTLDLTKETDVGDATAGILSSFSVLSYFVLILGIFLFSSLIICKRGAMRFGLLIANGCAFVYLFLTLPSGAWLAAVVAYVIILLLWKSHTAIYMILACLLFPFLPALKIYSVENFFEVLISGTNRYDLWNSVIRMLADFGIGGIGLGENAFSSLFSAYFIGNTEGATHSGSLLMQILISLGIFGLAVFALIVFFVIQSSLSYGRRCSDKSDFSRIMCYSGMCGVIASFIWGINEYIWYNPRVMLLFWLIMAVTVSARRSALELETNDRETNLYGDTYLE